MRLRVLLEPHHGATYQQILALATAAEEGGFDAFFRSDHYLGIDANDTTYQPTDSWTTLAGLAVQTSRVRLGTLVTASTFRLPGQLAVEVATVDQMGPFESELAGWLDRQRANVVVVRPDRYVLGAGPSLDGLTMEVRELLAPQPIRASAV